MNTTSKNQGLEVYFTYLLFLLAILIAGYFGFRALVTQANWANLNLYLLAIAAAIASFFSPCAFPLLPSYLSFYYGLQENNKANALKLGLSAALGVLSFISILALSIAIFGAAFAKGFSITQAGSNNLVLAWRAIVGILLISLGFAQLKGWSWKPKIADALAYNTRPQKGQNSQASKVLFLYGFGYTVAGIGCTGPILAGLSLTAFSAGGTTASLTAFAIYAIIMVLLMLLISSLVSLSHQTMINKLKSASATIKNFSSFLLIIVGIFNLYSVFALSSFIQLLFP